MIKPANKTMIGGFVVTAVILLAASIVIFGSGKFFQKRVDFILFFSDSVMGLNEGAPVLFKGVQIGRVKNITLLSNYDQKNTKIPVLIEVFPEKFGVSHQAAELPSHLAALVKRGLKAQLVSKSLVTGQMVIELEIYDHKSAADLAISTTPGKPMEIPTIPSTAARFARALENLDLEKLQNNIESILAGIDKLVNSPEIATTIAQLQSFLSESRSLLNRIDKHLAPLASNLEGTVNEYGRLAQHLQPLAQNLDRTVQNYNQLGENIGVRLDRFFTQLDLTMTDGRKLIREMHGSLAEDAPLLVKAEQSFSEVRAAARSLRQLTDYLRQHPESLLRGRSRQEN